MHDLEHGLAALVIHLIRRIHRLDLPLGPSVLVLTVQAAAPDVLVSRVVGLIVIHADATGWTPRF